MFESQQLVDLQENSSFGDAKSWLSGQEDQSSPSHLQRTHSSLSNATAGTSRNVVDPSLFNDLVELFPLVQSYLDRDRKVSGSFTRRGSMVYTKTPSRESLSRKITESKGRNATQSIPTKKRRDPQSLQDGGAESILISSTRTMVAEKENEELIALREQLEDLQRKLLEKDELLKSAEFSRNQMSAVQEELNDLKQLVAEKESVIKSTQSQLSDVKIRLADKQAALEKMQWEAMTSNRKVEKLQEDLNTTQGEIASFMLLFEGLMRNEAITEAEDYDITPYEMDHLPQIDKLDEMELQRMEEARKAYIDAVAVAKEKQDGESIAAAADARFHLQSFVLSTENMYAANKASPIVGFLK